MYVELLTHDVSFAHMVLNATEAALTTRGNSDKINDYSVADCERILKKIIKLGHETILEHIVLTYKIQDISRALLQELSRHRLTSPSVESSRYSFKKKFYEQGFAYYSPFHYDTQEFKEYCRIVNDHMKNIREFFEKFPDVSNDAAKYLSLECFSTNEILTLNLRELRHILKLRTSPQALKEFRDLAHEMYHVIPEEFTYLVEDCIYHE